MKTKLVLGSIVSFLIALGCDTVANAYTFRIDNFRIIRNGNLFFEDIFSDGSPPPSAPNFPNGNPVSYLVSGTVGPESGGKLTIDSAGATAVGSITGVGAFVFQQAVLSTSTDSSNLALGLKIDDTFSVTGLFDLVLPGSAPSEGYGIGLFDRVGASLGNDDLRLLVRRNDAGSVRVAFIRDDATANTFTILATALLDASHQQIALTLSRPTTTNNQIVASFAYVDGGVQGPTTTFPVSSTIFHNESFTRARFFTETPLFPTFLKATPGDQLVDLRWDSFTQGVRGWNVYFRQKSTVSWNRIANLGNPTDPQVPTTNQLFYRVDRNPLNGQKFLTNGISYEFSVTAVTNSGDESLKSTIVEALPNGLSVQNTKPPILFLHGIGVGATTWGKTSGVLENTFGWKFGGNLAIITYGQIALDPLRVCTLQNPCAQFTEGGKIGEGDFFTATFFNNNANYDNDKGIIQQGREVKAFLQKLHTLFPTGQTFRIVAHSMGGLAARSYLSGLDVIYDADVSQLITFGTPHLGTPVKPILDSIIGPIIVAGLALQGVQIDRDGDGIRDMEPPSAPTDFLSQLSSKSLAPSKYTSIVSFAPYPCFGNPVLHEQIKSVLGSSDCIVPTNNQNLGNIVFIKPTDRNRVFEYCCANRSHVEETSDYTTILSALGEGLVVVSRSPVDLQVTDPNGFRISKSLNEIPGASYEEFDIDGDGELNDVITIPFALAGDYQIRVIPDSEANPSETYSLETTINGVTTTLAQNQRLQDIPTQPFLVDVPLSVDIDIKPGGVPNSIQRRSQGRIPVAILSTDKFDAPARVNRLSLTFGHVGDETSLAFCNTDPEDVNGDGLPDLICHFTTQRTDFQVGDIEGVLKGQTVDGIFLRGTDSVRILQ